MEFVKNMMDNAPANPGSLERNATSACLDFITSQLGVVQVGVLKYSAISVFRKSTSKALFNVAFDLKMLQRNATNQMEFLLDWVYA